MHTKLRKCYKLATGFSCLIDPMNGLLDRLLKIKPPRLSRYCCSLVFTEVHDMGNHVGGFENLQGVGGCCR